MNEKYRQKNTDLIGGPKLNPSRLHQDIHDQSTLQVASQPFSLTQSNINVLLIIRALHLLNASSIRTLIDPISGVAPANSRSRPTARLANRRRRHSADRPDVGAAPLEAVTAEIQDSSYKDICCSSIIHSFFLSSLDGRSCVKAVTSTLQHARRR
ncbi:hypothetical protein VTN96DRAFT_3153 [Rasamsonia emersonii]